MSDSTAPAFDAGTFRNVLGHFPTGVTIVTGMHDDVPVGFTIGSFTSVSLDPPLVGFLPMHDSDTWAAMSASGAFCVNVLSRQQADLCWKFAKTDNESERFGDVELRTGERLDGRLSRIRSDIDVHRDRSERRCGIAVVAGAIARQHEDLLEIEWRAVHVGLGDQRLAERRIAHHLQLAAVDGTAQFLPRRRTVER